MPLPLLLVVPLLVAASGYGVKKGVDGVKDTRKAGRLNQSAQDLFDAEKDRLKQSRKQCTRELEKLGRKKLRIWDRDLGRFVVLFEQLKNVELEGQSRVGELGAKAFTKGELQKMRELSGYAAEATKAGAAALTTGALVGVASYGGAMMFAGASTGTAIGSLAGAAATNATLAWFGGGSLAAGGLGMAGGMAVLEGIVAAPVLAVGGAMFAAKARKNLALAKANKAKAQKAASEMSAARAVLEGIRRTAKQVSTLLGALSGRFERVLDELHALIESRGTDYRRFTEAERKKVFLAVQFAQVVKIVLEAPLLTKSGALRADHGKALTKGKKLLELAGQPT